MTLPGEIRDVIWKSQEICNQKKQNILTDILFELDIKSFDKINDIGKKYDGKTYLVTLTQQDGRWC